MPDVEPMFEEERYRRRLRTDAEFADYMANFDARIRHAGNRCELALATCTGRVTEPHHVFPQRLGRDDSFENLRACCASCNHMVQSMGKQTAGRLGLYSPVPLDPNRGDAA